MPMPHRTQLQVIKRRLVGKEGSERIRELRTILDELPGYRSGPYADIRKWVNAQMEETRARGRVVHRDSIAVRREGAAQIALVGPPNAGKSSLLQALSNVQIKTGDYPFTTTRPVPALTRLHGVLVQLVEIPGLIQGANDDRGGGRALLGVLRGADGSRIAMTRRRRSANSRRCAQRWTPRASTCRRCSSRPRRTRRRLRHIQSFRSWPYRSSTTEAWMPPARRSGS
jgi:hypothetical protein